jgi:hypothetical protein
MSLHDRLFDRLGARMHVRQLGDEAAVVVVEPGGEKHEGSGIVGSLEAAVEVNDLGDSRRVERVTVRLPSSFAPLAKAPWSQKWQIRVPQFGETPFVVSPAGSTYGGALATINLIREPLEELATRRRGT